MSIMKIKKYKLYQHDKYFKSVEEKREITHEICLFMNDTIVLFHNDFPLTVSNTKNLY